MCIIESTILSKHFAEQGVKIPIRHKIRQQRFARDEFTNSSNHGSNHSSSTPIINHDTSGQSSNYKPDDDFMGE